MQGFSQLFFMFQNVVAYPCTLARDHKISTTICSGDSLPSYATMPRISTMMVRVELPCAGLGVSCSADRQAVGKITKEGVFLEALETDPSKYLPEVTETAISEHVVKIDLNQPMDVRSVRLPPQPTLPSRVALAASA